MSNYTETPNTETTSTLTRAMKATKQRPMSQRNKTQKPTVHEMRDKMAEMQYVMTKLYEINMELKRQMERSQRFTLIYWLLRGTNFVISLFKKPKKQHNPIPKGWVKKQNNEEI